MQHQKIAVVRRRHKDHNLKRTNKQTILFNNHEWSAIDNYCSRFKIRSKTKFMREIIITEILRKFSNNYPSLFDDQPTLFKWRIWILTSVLSKYFYIIGTVFMVNYRCLICKKCWRHCIIWWIKATFWLKSSLIIINEVILNQHENEIFTIYFYPVYSCL